MVMITDALPITVYPVVPALVSDLQQFVSQQLVSELSGLGVPERRTRPIPSDPEPDGAFGGHAIARQICKEASPSVSRRQISAISSWV